MIGIYKITNVVNGKIYVGQSVNIETRLKTHFAVSYNSKSTEYHTAIHRAIRKYGKDNFKVEILELCERQELVEKEIFWINFFQSYHNGYNETSGGEGVCMAGEKHPQHKVSEKDVVDIRTRYKRLERRRDVYQLYQNKMSQSGFNKIWKGVTWKNIMMDVYTPENKEYHRHNTANCGETNGRTKLCDYEVAYIRRLRQQGKSAKELYEPYKNRIKYKSFTNILYQCNWKTIAV